MERLIVARGLPTLLGLLAIAVILIISGSAGFGLAFGLVVVGVAAMLLAWMFVYDLAHLDDRKGRRRTRVRQGPHLRGF